jgi:hypothetical protein
MGTRSDSELLAELKHERQDAPVPTALDDARRFERYYFRTLATAIIHPVPVIGLEPQECYVLTRDISRGGVSFLHPESWPLGSESTCRFKTGKRLRSLSSGSASSPRGVT